MHVDSEAPMRITLNRYAGLIFKPLWRGMLTLGKNVAIGPITFALLLRGEYSGN